MVLDLTRSGRAGDDAVPGDADAILHAGRVRFVNDCYNANVLSMTAALADAEGDSCAGRGIAVLGAMLELGAWTQSAHEEIGAWRRSAAWHFCWRWGRRAPWVGTRRCARVGSAPVLCLRDAAAARGRCAGLAAGRGFVLVKGSRGLKLEKVLDVFLPDELQAWFSPLRVFQYTTFRAVGAR